MTIRPKWTQPLWRAILRTARRFDSDAVKRLALCAPLLRAERQTAGLPADGMTDLLAEKVLNGTVDALRAAQHGSFSATVDLITSPAKLSDALGRQVSKVRVEGSGETPAALGDAGFQLLKALHGSLEQAETLISTPSIAATPPASLTTANIAQSAHVSQPIRTGDYLGFDPMAYPERCLGAVYATTPMVLLVLEGASAGSPGVGLVLNAPTRLRMRAHDWMHAVEVLSAVALCFG